MRTETEFVMLAHQSKCLVVGKTQTYLVASNFEVTRIGTGGVRKTKQRRLTRLFIAQFKLFLCGIVLFILKFLNYLPIETH